MKERSQGSSKPGLLRGLWAGWKRIAKKVGNFQARIFMAIFYFTLFCPFALAVRWGSDPLGLKAGDLRGWRTIVAPNGSSLNRARKQFS